MYKVKVNDKFDYEVNGKAGAIVLDGNPFAADVSKLNAREYHLIHQDKSYRVGVVDLNSAEKTGVIKVNGNIYQLKAKDQFDTLLEQLGLSNLNASKVSDIKAPMPGMVLKVLVAEGDNVSKADNLFVLEAMKMENIIKAPADAVIKSIKIEPGDKVEKGQLLILFR